jgi:hypothetical protein
MHDSGHGEVANVKRTAAAEDPRVLWVVAVGVDDAHADEHVQELHVQNTDGRHTHTHTCTILKAQISANSGSSKGHHTSGGGGGGGSGISNISATPKTTNDGQKGSNSSNNNSDTDETLAERQPQTRAGGPTHYSRCRNTERTSGCKRETSNKMHTHRVDQEQVRRGRFDEVVRIVVEAVHPCRARTTRPPTPTPPQDG